MLLRVPFNGASFFIGRPLKENPMLNYINKHATNRQKSKKHVPQLLGRIELK